jgi:hypothetical protein
MDMAAFSLAAMKHLVPVSVEMVTATSHPHSFVPNMHNLGVVGFSSDASITAHIPSIEAHEDVPSLAAASSNIARKVYKTAYKPRSVTQVVLVDEREAETGVISAPTTTEVAGLTMSLQFHENLNM